MDLKLQQRAPFRVRDIYGVRDADASYVEPVTIEVRHEGTKEVLGPDDVTEINTPYLVRCTWPGESHSEHIIRRSHNG